MKKLFFVINIVLIASSVLLAQKEERIIGKVTFVTSQNVYVKFDDMDKLNVGDTLFSINDDYSLKPAVVVKYLSSNSSAGNSIIERKFSIGEELIAVIKIEEEKDTVSENVITEEEESSLEIEEPNVKQKSVSEIQSNFSGRLSISSYSYLSNSQFADNQRWRYLASFDAENISGSNISLSSYITFSYRTKEWNEISNNIGKALRVYEFAANYDFSKKTKLLFGRKINRKVSSLSAVDGLQFETIFGNYSTGIILGSRPNFGNYGYNLKMFEYGVYVNRTDTLTQGLISTTLGIFEQTNNFKTDRRFIYFQHNNILSSEFNFFVSSELDLYKRKKGSAQNTLDLTSLFISANYSPSRWISFNASYDARKNVVYYETFKDYADSLLESETRQGFRFRTNIRPVNYLLLSANYGFRTSAGDIKPSRNFGGLISYSRIPFLYISSSISYNNLRTSYVDGSILNLRLSKYFFNGEVNSSIGYKKVDYSYANGSANLLQDIITYDISLRFFERTYFNLTYEGIFEKARTYNRIYIGLTKRF